MLKLEVIENTIIVLNGMKVICGLCRTEKEAIDTAIEIIEKYVSIMKEKEVEKIGNN